jgi:hypothetical protein
MHRWRAPQERKFKPDFLDDILPRARNYCRQRWSSGAGADRTSWNPVGPLGSFETWCQWCRDPLLALDMKIRSQRIAEIKADDPGDAPC